jgi:hypothetical protein
MQMISNAGGRLVFPWALTITRQRQSNQLSAEILF